MRNMWSTTQEPWELLLKAQGYLEIKAETQDNTVIPGKMLLWLR